MKSGTTLLSIVSMLLSASLLRADTAAEALAAYAKALRRQFPEVTTITTKELSALDPAPILLDVREEKEFAVSHLAGAIRVENDAIAQLQKLGISKDALIVVYCSVGYRSSVLAKKLQKAGFTHVRNLEGSLFAWANEDRPLVNANGATEGVHPFNILWGRYLDKAKWCWKPAPKSVV